jgi:hypothetical protein
VIAGLRAHDAERARNAIQSDIVEGGPFIEAVLRAQIKSLREAPGSQANAP